MFVTTDRNIRYQQNLTRRKIAIVILSKGRWTLIRKRLAEIAATVAAATLEASTRLRFRSTDQNHGSNLVLRAPPPGRSLPG